LLCKNTSGLGNVDPLNVAIGPVSGVQKMFDPRLGNNAYRTFGAEEHFVGNVNVVSVDAVLQDYPSYTPFIAKIDIEGFEGEQQVAGEGLFVAFDGCGSGLTSLSAGKQRLFDGGDGD
jgi:hypothetical protein